MCSIIGPTLQRKRIDLEAAEETLLVGDRRTSY